MEIVAEMPDTRVEGFLAAGHAATITGWGVFEDFARRHQVPVVVAGFEPLDVIMGPGCPVCVTDLPEVDEAVALARQGVRVATYGDMLKVRGTRASLADAHAEGARVDVVYGIAQAVELARRTGDEVVFFASGFETTAVATAAVLLADPPPSFSVLSAHKYILSLIHI